MCRWRVGEGRIITQRVQPELLRPLVLLLRRVPSVELELDLHRTPA